LAVLGQWRLYVIVVEMKAIKKSGSADQSQQIHALVFHQFVEWLSDLPYAPFLIVSLVGIWRLPALYRSYRKVF